MCCGDGDLSLASFNAFAYLEVPSKPSRFGAREITRKTTNRLTLGNVANSWAPGFARKGSPTRCQDKKADRPSLAGE
jgi:hypothetical protein